MLGVLLYIVTKDFLKKEKTLMSAGNTVLQRAIGSSSRGRIIGEFLRHLYISTLMEFDRDQVRRFWSQIPFREGAKYLSEEELFDKLFSPGQKFNLSYQLEILDYLEAFLQTEGLDAERFQQIVSRRNRGSRYLSAKTWLYELNPFMERFFNQPDLRNFLLEIYHELPQVFGEEVDHRQVSIRQDGEFSVSMVSCKLRNVNSQRLNYEAWLLPWLVNFPNLFGMPSYENAKMIADLQGLENFFVPEELSSRNKKITWNDEEIADVVLFSTLCEKSNINFKELAVDDMEVALAKADVWSEDGKVKLLTAGCAYGAPASLVELRYLTKYPSPTNPFQLLIEMLEWEEEVGKDNVNKLHRELLGEVSNRLEVSYFAAEDSISVNGRHIIKNVPARIFRRVVREYVDEGKTIFEYREFKRDIEICSDPANPNFEVRLQRLMEKVKADFPEFKLQKERRGQFSFKAKQRVVYGVR
jgi:hypothetical protein